MDTGDVALGRDGQNTNFKRRCFLCVHICDEHLGYGLIGTIKGTIKHDLDSRGYDLDFDSDVGGPYTTLSRVLYTR